MTKNSRTARIFMIPIQYPCGPNFSCCGPIGQSEEEVQNLRDSIERGLGFRVEVVNAMDGSIMKNHLSVLRLLRTFGPVALPVVSLDDEIVSMGNPTPEEAVSALREKVNQR